MTTITEAQAERWSSAAWNGHWRLLLDDGSELRWRVDGWAPEEFGSGTGLMAQISGEGIASRIWRRTHMVRLALKIARRRSAPTVRIAAPSRGACCSQATPVLCVCSQAWSCPTHGETHIGSHD